jgi:O-acetyl-ADP-ribose deacetylase (regulator of RNase III)
VPGALEVGIEGIVDVAVGTVVGGGGAAVELFESSGTQLPSVTSQVRPEQQ